MVQLKHHSKTMEHKKWYYSSACKSWSIASFGEMRFTNGPYTFMVPTFHHTLFCSTFPDIGRSCWMPDPLSLYIQTMLCYFRPEWYRSDRRMLSIPSYFFWAEAHIYGLCLCPNWVKMILLFSKALRKIHSNRWKVHVFWKTPPFSSKLVTWFPFASSTQIAFNSYR